MLSCSQDPSEGIGYDFTGWSSYNGDPGRLHYSSLTEIDTTNVTDLKPVWIYNSGGADTAAHSQIQCNPLVIDSVLYGVSPQMVLFAINAANGKEYWRFDPNDPSVDVHGATHKHIIMNIRGMAYWSDGLGDRRLFYTAGSRTYAVDASTGHPIPDFGSGGFIDLHHGLGRNVDDLLVVSTSPGVVYKDVLIMGHRVDESLPSAPGHIRAFDVRTGEQRWIFHTIPKPYEIGFDTWDNPNAHQFIGGANVWSGFSLDEERGLVFCGTGSASYDFWGGNRTGENLFANCILALDAATGERRWHYQTLHHDLWDKDLPTPPTLVTVQHNGEAVDAVAQPTKNGYLYLLNRDTGDPLFPVEEVPVPTEGALPGEKPHPTQPIPTIPAPFARQSLQPTDINPYLSEEDQAAMQDILAHSRLGSPYLLPGEDTHLLLPGFDGGGEWGGPSFDPQTGIMYVNANNMAWLIKMNKVEWKVPAHENWVQAGQRLYGQYCQSCHGANLQGTGNNPGLLTIKDRIDESAFTELLATGRRMMPSFAHLEEEEVRAIASYVLELEEAKKNTFSIRPGKSEDDPNFLPYRLNGYKKFLTKDGMPGMSPPWGTLTAIDLNAGEHVWSTNLGEYPEYRDRGIPATGTENYGGSVVTAGGLLFIAATLDGKFRAFNKRTGELLWEYDLPAAGFATPAIYEQNGKQYVVIACGGGKLNTVSGDQYLAFGL